MKPIKIRLFNNNTPFNNSTVVILLALLVVMLCAFKGCTADKPETPPQPSTGQIYLYGELHGNDNIYAAELEQWQSYYQEQNMRHLFVELPYYTAEFLNLWLQADNDDILNEIYEDLQGTVTYDTNVRDFYRQIKQTCPETVFHGTDLGHQYNSTGQRFLDYLQAQELEDTEKWQLAQECIAQGQHFYENNSDMDYREDMMTENFIRAFDSLENADIMGIYGAAHTWLGDEDTNNCMADRLQKRYGEAVQSTDFTYLAMTDIEPLRMDTLTIAGQEFQAAYFGEQDLTGLFPEYKCRRFWRLENAYTIFQNYPTNDDVLPYNNYPMLVETGNVYVVEYETTDGEISRNYYRADGNTYQGMPTTNGVNIPE